MSELTAMAERIQETMEALDQAHQAGNELREAPNHKALQDFLDKMNQLQEHLNKLKFVLDNEEAYAMDELMDALSSVYSDHRADYRRTPRMRE